MLVVNVCNPFWSFFQNKKNSVQKTSFMSFFTKKEKPEQEKVNDNILLRI